MHISKIAQSSKIFVSTIELNILITGGARGVMVIVVGNGHGDTNSNPEGDWLHFI